MLFIAPLLYEEAKSADKAALWHHKRPVLSLAIGLVVATTLAIGFAVHAVIPSIGLAAAFALGAALGPTDAVAVTSLSKQVNIPDRQGSILKGELLLNDASGIVSFQFAIAAAVTGSFSLLNATGNFFVEFLGGIAVGALLAYIGKFLVNKARSLGVENTTFHVLFEPHSASGVFDCRAVHVSGIIARCRCGPHQRDLPACDRTFHLAHEHRVFERVACAHLRLERLCVRASGHTVAAGHGSYVG